jgi:DnaJ-class molecular chaperone
VIRVDHYRTLQVARDAEPEVVEKAYKALSMKYHPDRVPERRRADATVRMQKINEAYRVLSDPRLRARYDLTLRPEVDPGGAWDRFLDDGLVGLFNDWLRTREGG